MNSATKNNQAAKVKKKLKKFSWGKGLILLAFASFFVVYWPLLRAEFKYWLSQDYSPKKELDLLQEPTPPPEDQFSIRIDKINLQSPIIKNVDPFSQSKYQQALRQGVAHASTSALPDQPGSTVLFAHSTGTIFDVARFNAVFYLLHKLQPGDQLTVTYSGQIYQYQIQEKKVVEPDQISYLSQDQTADLVLITCTPAGTQLRRLIVLAKQINK